MVKMLRKEVKDGVRDIHVAGRIQAGWQIIQYETEAWLGSVLLLYILVPLWGKSSETWEQIEQNGIQVQGIIIPLSMLHLALYKGQIH